MPISAASELAITPTDTGSMVEVPADLLDGHYRTAITVRDGTDDDGYYRLYIDWKVLEDLDGNNPNEIGKSTTTMLTFYPEEHKNAKMNHQECKNICEALQLSEPDTSGLKDGDNSSLAEWVEALEATQAEIWTKSKLDKNDVMRTRVMFKQPGKKLVPVAQNGAPRKPGLRAVETPEDEGEDNAKEETPKTATKTKKTNKR